MFNLFTKTSEDCSKIITKRYSTSFSMGILAFSREFRAPIYNIYGFVRFADEIVDTFHDYDKAELLKEFKNETYKAIKMGISLNPVLHSFQKTVNEYNISWELIEAFFASMEMDLQKADYVAGEYNNYIYGSAEVIGLMCLKVFCKGQQSEYDVLSKYARRLGSAFQKVNFLRDIKSDYDERGRVYFPGVEFNYFDNAQKEKIEEEIQKDFEEAYIGIKRLPKGVRFGVYVAYVYYMNLFKKIRNSNVNVVKKERIRVNDRKKMILFLKSAVRHSLNLM